MARAKKVQDGGVEEAVDALWRKLLAPLADPSVWVWLLLILMAREAVVWGFSKASGGIIDLKSKEQELIECILRQINNPDFKNADATLAGIKGCIPEKVGKEG